MALDLEELRYAGKQAKLAVPEKLPQRQDSLEAQLLTVQNMAQRAGCYDAVDWLRVVRKQR